MLITIRDSRITAIVDSTDAQLISLRDASGREYIWQHDPKYWKRCSPLPFPVVGNHRNDRIILEDRMYAIEKHGFCRERNFDVSRETSSKAVFSTGDTPNTYKAYPYASRPSLTYELKDGVLLMKYQVENRDQRGTWYAIGAHPEFNYPMEEGYALEGYQLAFEREGSTASIPYNLDQFHFAPYKTDTMSKGSIPPLGREMFKYDAVLLDRLNSRAVSILSPATGCGMEMGFPGFETVALWTLCPEPAPYLCVGPWGGSGIYENEDDQFSHRHHIQRFCPGDNCSCVMTIQILERFSEQ